MGKHPPQLKLLAIFPAVLALLVLLLPARPAAAQTSTPTSTPTLTPVPTATPWPTSPVLPAGDILDGLPAVPTPFDLDSLPAPVATLDLSQVWAGESIEMLFSTAPAVALLPAALPGWDYFVYFILLLAGVKLLMKMRSARSYEETTGPGTNSPPQSRGKNSMKV